MLLQRDARYLLALLQTVQPEYGQLERHKLQLHLYLCWRLCPVRSKNFIVKSSSWKCFEHNQVFGWLPMYPRQLNKVNPLFSSFSILQGFCSIKRYRMKSNTFLLIWSVVTPGNNTGIRHFGWASCWSQHSQKKSWNDFRNCTLPRPNLIVFLLGNVSNGGVSCLLWKFTKKSSFQPS